MLQGYLDSAKKRVCWHRTGFDRRYNRYSPGVMLYQKTIERMIGDDIDFRVFDLSIGTEEYKFRLGAEEYHDRNFDIVPINENF
jgi:CelD/BcsL family acetyltransferase involved in cellulose biosynthesis